MFIVPLLLVVLFRYNYHCSTELHELVLIHCGLCCINMQCCFIAVNKVKKKNCYNNLFTLAMDSTFISTTRTDLYKA